MVENALCDGEQIVKSTQWRIVNALREDLFWFLSYHTWYELGWNGAG